MINIEYAYLNFKKKKYIYIYLIIEIIYIRITSKLRFGSEIAAARRLTKINYQKKVLFLAVLVDICPVRRLHGESCFSHEGSRLLNPARNFAFFLAKCVLNFTKKVPKFRERVNR